MPFKILILGHKGTLGSEMMRQYSKKYDVVGIDKSECDIVDKVQLRSLIEAVFPSIVINTVAYNDVDKAEREFSKAMFLNSEIVGEIANITDSLRMPLIHFSTDYVFDGKNKLYEEKDEPSPLNNYGISKWAGEKELILNCRRHYLVRLSRLFGITGGGKQSFVDKILEQIKENKRLEILESEISSPTYSVDLTRFVEYLFTKDLPFGIYHGSNSGACTWYEFAEEILKIKGLNDYPLSGIKKSIRPAKVPTHSILINTKTKMQRSWREALREFLTN